MRPAVRWHSSWIPSKVAWFPYRHCRLSLSWSLFWMRARHFWRFLQSVEWASRWAAWKASQCFVWTLKKTFQIHQSVSIFPSLKLPWIGASQFSDRLADWPVLAGLLRLDAEVERLRGRKASRAHIVSTPKTRGITSKCTACTCMQMYANVVYVRPSWYTHQCYWELSQALVSFFFFRGPCFRVMCFSKRPVAKIGITNDTIFEGWFEATRGHKVGVACWPKGPFAESWWLLL